MPHTPESRRKAAQSAKTYPVSDVRITENRVTVIYANGIEYDHPYPIDEALRMHGAGARAIYEWKRGVRDEYSARQIAKGDCV